MVHGLAAQSGGKLVLSSTAGKGTTAELWLPVSVATPEQSMPLNEGATDGVGRARCRLKVLFVDDDPLVLMSTKAMIEDLGHRVVTANSGDEALTVISDHVDVDLVITDHIMPSMTGTELARHIARLDPALPVIIASGFTDNPTLTTVITQRLPKPFNQLELARAIASISRS